MEKSKVGYDGSWSGRIKCWSGGKSFSLDSWKGTCAWRLRSILTVNFIAQIVFCTPYSREYFLFNQVVGNTTSGCYSPATGKGLVFAYIPRILDTPGLEVHVELMGNMHNAKVLERPPVLTQPMREKAKAKEKLAAVVQ